MPNPILRRRGDAGAGVPPWVLRGASLDLDFANGRYYGGGLAALLSLSRASTGYAQTAAVVWQSFGNNVLRITDQGLLIEEARTNLLTQSQSFDNAAWSKTDTTITPDATLAPDGTQTADMATQGSVGNANITQAYTATAGAPQAAAVFLKRGNNDWMRVTIFNGADQANTWVNIATGQAGTTNNGGTSSGAAVSLVPSSNGWYRVVVTGTPSTTAATLQLFVSAVTGNGATTRTSGGSYYVWQADANNNATFITSPIVTAGASATRAADVPQLIGSAASAALAAKAAFFQTTQVATGQTDPRLLAQGASATPAIYFPTGTTNVARIANSGALNTASATFGSGTIAGVSKIAANFDNSSMEITANGGSKGTAPNAWGGSGTTYPGNYSGGIRALNGYMQRFALSQVKGQFDNLTV